jgi:outer membrane protein assembly factor BamB
VRWKKERQHISDARKTGKGNVPMAYSTPLLIEVDGQPQLISAASDHVVAYDPATGDEIWWSRYYGYSNVPRPVFGKGMIFVSSGYDGPNLYAIRVGGKGDVTDTHVAWTLKKGGTPLNPSPLLVGDELYLVSDAGIATCLNAETGKQHWQQRLGGAYSASPVLADGAIYLLSEEGLASVIKAGTEFEKLADNPMEERCLASPAIVDGAIFLRTAGHLYRIEKK